MTDDEIIGLAKSLGWNVEHHQTNRMLVLFARALVQRKPLTDEEIKAIGGQAFGIDIAFDGHLMKFARAIEQAHGIGEQHEQC